MIAIINWINEWIQGIIIAVIIATIIEMIIPEGKNKKYIKTVIGIYILFTTIYPIIDKISTKKINLNEIMKSEIYASADADYETMSNNLEKSTNENIEKNYLDTIKSEIRIYLENEGYRIKDIWVDIETENTDKYGEIYNINISIYKKEETKNYVNEIQKVNISLNETKNVTEEKNSETYEEIKEYLMEIYGVSKENIIISFEKSESPYLE